MGSTIDQLNRFIQRPLSSKENDNFIGPKWNSWIMRVICLGNGVGVIASGVRNEFKDAFKLLKLICKIAEDVFDICTFAQFISYAETEKEPAKGREWKHLKKHGTDFCDTVGAIIVRPFATTADCVKYVAGALLHPSIAVRDDKVVGKG